MKTRNITGWLKIIVFIAAVQLSVATCAQITFDIPGATETYVTGINIDTDVCGYAVFPGNVIKGFVRTDGDTIMLEYQANINTWAGGINDLGQVVGRYNSTGMPGDYHAYIYNIYSETFTALPELDGFELLSPNDINNEGWISGDLKDAAQRRIFTYHEDEGMVTNFVLINGDVWPTYGGHDIDINGKTSAYYIEGSTHRGVWFQNGLGFSDTLDFPDPFIPSAHKTRPMGGNSTTALISFFQSRTAVIYDLATEELVQKLSFPDATEVYGIDINEEGYIAGHYLDENYVVHGFFQAKEAIEFLPSQDGWSFVNNGEDCWNELDYNTIIYATDPYMADEMDTVMLFPEYQPGEPFPAISFSSWSDFVKAFGPDQCYVTDQNVNYVEQSPLAFNTWYEDMEFEFQGICWGMVSTALLAQDSIEILESSFPETMNALQFNEPAAINSLLSDQYIIPAARISQNKQRSQIQWERVISGFQETPQSVVVDIYSGLDDPGEITKQIVIKLLGQTIHGAHAIMPYAMERDAVDINRYKIFVYDPNEPFDDSKCIEIQYEDTASWYRYNFGGTYTTWTDLGLRYDDWVENFTETQPLYSPNNLTAPEYRDDYYVLTFVNKPDIILEGGQGGTMIMTGDEYSNTLVGSETIFPVTGLNAKANRFRLDPLPFNAEVTSLAGKPFYASYNSDNGTIIYRRNDTQTNSMDGILTNQAVFSYENIAGVPLPVEANILTQDEAGVIYQYYCTNLKVAADQQIDLEIVDATHIMITSNDAATSYDVRIRIFDPETGFWESSASGIAIGSDVTQLLIPGLNGDTFEGVIVETDANQDGDFETSDTYLNEGIPNMLLSDDEVTVPALGGSGDFYVSNVGGGNLNWNIVSQPSWITINDGSQGINHGPVNFNATDNLGETRAEWIIVEAAAPSNDQDSVWVIQPGINDIDVLHLKDHISVSPNPASAFVQFARPVDNGVMSYEIVDGAGRIASSGMWSGMKKTIDTSLLARGVYSVRFINGDTAIVIRLVLS